ncbi:MAG: thioredoxin domain-containing protein [Bryobacteraceae bacterium]|jgi:protein-disulfide isomerase
MKLFVIALTALLPCLAASSDADSGKSLGTPNAPIRIEVFSDFECPACKGLHEQVLPLVMRDYVIPGKVYLVSREFPLPGHPYSREAANYAVAAARLGKYQEVTDALFLNQVALTANGKVWDTVAGVLTPAEAKRVQLLAKDPSVLSAVQHDLEEGRAAGINQTPTMIITRGLNRVPVAGAINYLLLKTLLDGLLAK